VIESDTSPSLCSVAPEACIVVADGCTLDSDLSKKIKQKTGNQAKWIPPFTWKGERGREGLEEDALIDVLGDSPVSPLRIARLVSMEWIARTEPAVVTRRPRMGITSQKRKRCALVSLRILAFQVLTHKFKVSLSLCSQWSSLDVALVSLFPASTVPPVD